MFYIYWQETNKIEISFSGELTREEFQQIIHQLESLAAMYQEINVLFDAANLRNYNFKVVLDEYDFYKKYKSHLKRVALVSDKTFQNFVVEQFNKFSETEFKAFAADEIDKARKWIFPSRLPG